MANADRLIELFNGAKIRPTGAVRGAWLAAKCGDDAALKAQVISLVDAHESAGGFLLTSPEFSPEIEATLARLKPEEAGQQIGLYKLREQIGEGGFGTVWVAEQQVPVRRTVALKIIKLGMDTEDVVARFGQERQALAMMDHPNIARVLDAGATEWGRPFFVMELVRGIRITDYCDQANLPTVERLALFIQVCHAVQHAHQKGIIHRDLKPSNILVTLHDGVPVPKVIDFGVAKATQGRLAEHTVYTRFQQMVGTPLYMSPEQAEMNGIDVDTRTDIYALGVLLYELLTGRTPFDADALLKAGLDEMRRVIREQEPQKPSTALVTMAQAAATVVAHHRASEPPKLIHAIRGDLDWIVMKTLEKDRARRYDTANGLAMDIQRHLDNEPVVARPPSAGYRFQKLVRRNQLAFAASGAIAAALVIGFTTATWMYFRESDARKRATHSEQLATERLAEVSAERDAKEVARQEAEAISTFMSEVFQSPDPARDGRTITVAETLDRAAKKLETELADQPARRAKLQATLGDTYRALGLYRQAIPLGEKALNYHRSASGPEHPDTIMAMSRLVQFYQSAGRFDEAFKLCEEALARSRKVLGQEHDQTIRLMTSLAYFYGAAGRLDEELKLREETLALSRKVLGPEHDQTIRAIQGLAQFHHHTASRQDEVIKVQEEVLTRYRTVRGPEHPDTLGAMLALANTYHSTGRFDEGRKLREEMLALSRKVYGPEHPRTLQAMHNLTFSHADTGRRDEALKLREEVLVLDRKVLGPEHPQTLYTMEWLVNSYDSVGRRDEALKLGEELLEIRRRVLGPEHQVTLGAMNDLAMSYVAAARWDEALKLREELLSLRRKVLGPEHQVTLGEMNNLMTSYAAAGRWDEVFKLGEEMLAIQRKVNGPEHDQTISAMHRLATFYHQAGRPDEALKLHDEALKLRKEALDLRRKEHGPDHSDTIWAMDKLADSYLQADRVADALSLLANASARKPEITQLAVKLAALQVWFGKEAEHAATCRRMLQWAADTSDPEAAERVAKLTCLRPIGDAPTQKTTLALARQAVKLWPEKSRFLPYAHMVLGMAEYRSGQYPAADDAVTTAAKTSGGGVVHDTASFYRAMSLFRQGSQDEARDLFTTTEAKMKPFPADEKNPLADGKSTADHLILWLACKEARALLNAPPGK